MKNPDRLALDRAIAVSDQAHRCLYELGNGLGVHGHTDSAGRFYSAINTRTAGSSTHAKHTKHTPDQLGETIARNELAALAAHLRLQAQQIETALGNGQTA